MFKNLHSLDKISIILTAILTVAKSFYPDIPDEALYVVIVWLLGRLGVSQSKIKE